MAYTRHVLQTLVTQAVTLVIVIILVNAYICRYLQYATKMLKNMRLQNTVSNSVTL